MTEMHTARVAILADSPLQRHVLQQVLADNGYHVVLNSQIAGCGCGLRAGIDVVIGRRQQTGCDW